jgi:hypothetical protein
LIVIKKVAAKPKTLPRKRPSKWTKEVVSERALDLFVCERIAADAYGRAIERCEKFKEVREIDRINHADPAFRRYTAKQWDAYLTAKREVAKAKARLTTACRNHLTTARRADPVIARTLKKVKPVAPKPVPQADDWLDIPF